MAQTARVQEPLARALHRKLGPVADLSRKPARPSAARQTAVAQRNCRLFIAFVTVVAALGMGRVWLSVQATAASLDATELRSSIKSERYRGDMLEVRQSALGSPSRIRAIAGKAMGMTPAKKVSYLDLTAGEVDVAREVSANAGAGSGSGKMLAKLLDLTAGEAQVLLVGDVGLATSR